MGIKEKNSPSIQQAFQKYTIMVFRINEHLLNSSKSETLVS
jgi:hypothetical protein